MRIILAGIVLLCDLGIPIVCESGTPALVSFVAERKVYRASVEQLLLQQRFEALETHVRELREQRPRFSSGLQRLYDFYQALNLAGSDASLAKFEERMRLLQQWRIQWPKSGTPKVGLACVHRTLAWKARGGGWASSVTPEGWRGYREHARNAVELLEDVHLHNTTDPALYDFLLRARKELGRPRADIEEAFRLGTALDIQYDHLYNGMAQYLLPRWYGRPGEIEAFAAQAAEQTKAWIGDGMYVRVAVNALLPEGEESPHSYTFNWPRLKGGLRDLDRAFPHSSRTVNYMARLACLYRDVPLAVEALARLRDSWDGDAQDIWQTRAAKEACRR